MSGLYPRPPYVPAHYQGDLIEGAVQAAQWALSWRQGAFNVHPSRTALHGAAILGFKFGATFGERFKIATGANLKLFRGRWAEGVQKMCAERAALIELLCLGMAGAYGIATFSDDMQPDDVSGEFCNIQHPCFECRTLFDALFDDCSPVLLIRHCLPCDLDPRAYKVGDLLVERWTFGEICKAHSFRRAGRR